MIKHKAIAVNTKIAAYIPKPGSDEGTPWALFDTQEEAVIAAEEWCNQLKTSTGITEGWNAFHESWMPPEEVEKANIPIGPGHPDYKSPV
jgi:hypothetical protein